jgi:hypothetical protein
LLIRYTIGKLSNQAQIEYTVSQKACLRTWQKIKSPYS